jgi:hypothetical protein
MYKRQYPINHKSPPNPNKKHLNEINNIDISKELFVSLHLIIANSIISVVTTATAVVGPKNL